ncbi:MAG: PstS family phosphate ABC transporter substrate-binding protein [Rikenellaceae bacterium]
MIVVLLATTVVSLGAQEIEVDKHEERKDKRLFKRDIRKEKREEKRSLEGEIQISGAFALYPMVSKWAAEFTKIYPKVKIDISAGGSGKGITDALSEMVDIGMISRELTQGELELGAVVVPVVRDAVVLVANAKNPDIIDLMTKGVSIREARTLWSGSGKMTWGQLLGTESTKAVHLYTRADASGASETIAHLVGTYAEKLAGTAVYSDPGVASVVQRDKLALGYTSLAYAYNLRTGKFHRDIFVVPLDLNDDGVISLEESFYMDIAKFRKAVIEGKYPTPPARFLYFVISKNNKSPEVEAFVDFILTRGQQYAPQSGYIPLDN